MIKVRRDIKCDKEKQDRQEGKGEHRSKEERLTDGDGTWHLTFKTSLISPEASIDTRAKSKDMSTEQEEHTAHLRKLHPISYSPEELLNWCGRHFWKSNIKKKTNKGKDRCLEVIVAPTMGVPSLAWRDITCLPPHNHDELL